MTFEHLSAPPYNPNGTFAHLLEDVASTLARQYGGLYRPSYMAASMNANPAIEHFLGVVEPNYVIAFILACFRSWHYQAGQEGVNAINRILREAALGYEFTPYVEREVEQPGKWRKRKAIEIDYPEVITKQDEVTHAEIIKPCLAVLGKPLFKAAGDHLLKAHDHYRNGNCREAITEALSALETTLKTICTEKGWQYQANKDGLDKLTEIVTKNGLVFPFYDSVLKSTGTIRSRLGAHGKEPQPIFAPSNEHVEHMLNLTSSHILFLTRSAGLA